MRKNRAAEQDGGKGRWQDWLSDLALRGLVGTVGLLPVRTRLALVGWAVAKVIAPLLGWYQRVDANIDHVWPDTPGARKREIAEAAIANLGRAIIENYDPQEMKRRAAAYPVTGPGVPALEQAVAEGRPVLLLTGHFGNPVCARSALVARGYTVAVLLRPLSNPYSNARYVKNYKDVCEPVFEQGRRGTMGLLKYIRDGGVASMAFDVFDGSGPAIDFLGQPAPTALSPAEMARKTGALLIPYFGVRRPDGYGFDCVVEDPIADGDPLDMMTEATRRLESWIERDPGQWMWTHRRWKPKRQMKRQRKRAAATM